jgi:2-methylisocitrate lyase-like PEP mutase family enzyme
VIFVEAPQSEQEIEAIAAAVDAPLLINIVPGGLTPALDSARLADLGYRIAIHPVDALFASATAAIQALRELREPAPEPGSSADPEGFFELLGLSRWTELGDRYGA